MGPFVRAVSRQDCRPGPDAQMVTGWALVYLGRAKRSSRRLFTAGRAHVDAPCTARQRAWAVGPTWFDDPLMAVGRRVEQQ